MPTSPRPDSEHAIRRRSLPGSPRAAAEGALVYRRRLRQVPRESKLRIAAWVGTLLIHLGVLFMIILGPAYDWEPRPMVSDAEALKIRLIDKAPPPVPPIRGTPSRAPVQGKRAATSASAATASRKPTPRSSAAPLPAIVAPTPAPPDVKLDTRVTAPAPSVVATPERPPQPSSAPPPQPELQPVPKPDQAPPDLAIDTPPPKIVPPAFQPEPVRKPQAEGLEAMPPPPSLAMPPVPVAPSKMAESPPTLVAESVSRPPTTAMTLASVPRPDVVETSTPPTPQLESVPRVAVAPTAPAPDVRLEKPSVPRETVKAAMPAEVSAPPAELAAVPIDDASLRPAMAAPAPTPDAGKLDVPSAAPSRVQSARATAEAEAQAADASAAAATAAANEAAQSNAAGAQAAAMPSSGSAAEPATAPGGTDAAVATVSGNPGVATGSEAGTRPTGANGTSTSEASSNGKAGVEPGVANAGDKNGAVGDYIQLKPHGNTDVMTHGRVQIQYKPTRFDDAWTPKGESSVDTALRHAVEKTTTSHTFNLPRGVRIKCTLTPLLPMAIFGCGGADPPPGPVAQEMYKVNTLAPANPVAQATPASVATVAAAPVLDNSTMCATARVAGGPLPPGCDADVQVKIAAPKAGDSWVPASDQFK